MSGLTPTGFDFKLLSDILSELQIAERAQMGADYLTSSDSIGGQLNGIYADQLMELWQVAAAIYAGMRRDTAAGFQVDDIGQLVGITRLAATQSTVFIRLGRPSTSITFPSTFTVSDPNDPTKKFKINAATLVSAGTTQLVPFTAVNYGAVYANAGTLTKIDSPVTGTTTIAHETDATPGRDYETDAAYKQRQEISLSIQGNGTDSAIRAALLQVYGVTYASVFFNNTMFTSPDGLPAKSVEAIVRGGDPDSIRLTLWNKVAFGISTYGNTSGTLVDALGNNQTIVFSRPVDVQLYMQADLLVNDTQFPGVAYFNQLMINYINTIQPGQQVVFNKLYDIAFNCPGVTDAYLSMSKVVNVSNTANLTFAKRENAVLQSANCITGVIGSL